jgi:uncharacterized RDD family membrane protein YckC
MTASSAEVLGRRIRAAWIDLGVLAIVFVVFSVVFGGFHSGSSTLHNAQTTVHSSRVSVSLTGIPLVLFLVAELVYYFGLETRSGQTVGKRIMRVRVVSVDGSRASARAVLLRTVGRILDVLPAFYLVGWLALRRNSHPRQRLGDRLAQTTVVGN